LKTQGKYFSQEDSVKPAILSSKKSQLDQSFHAYTLQIVQLFLKVKNCHTKIFNIQKVKQLFVELLSTQQMV